MDVISISQALQIAGKVASILAIVITTLQNILTNNK